MLLFLMLSVSWDSILASSCPISSVQSKRWQLGNPGACSQGSKQLSGLIREELGLITRSVVTSLCPAAALLLSDPLPEIGISLSLQGINSGSSSTSTVGEPFSTNINYAIKSIHTELIWRRLFANGMVSGRVSNRTTSSCVLTREAFPPLSHSKT